MSTAFYPTNMRRQSASGYSNKSTTENIPYVPWKGTGIFSNPVGVTSTHIRPLTNLDPGNVFPTGFGLPRPIKHYRKGTVIPFNFNIITIDPNNTSAYVETSLIEYNVNRAVKSSTGQSLGGGTGLIAQLIDTPGSFIVKDNGIKKSIDGITIDAECANCNGVGIVSNWMPINNLSEKPEPNVTDYKLCCNQQKKALQRVLPANTNVKKNYFQTTDMYLYNRCQTFQQRQFNFVTGPIDKKILDLFLAYPFVTAKIIEYSKPGDPLSIANFYVAQCNPNFMIEKSVEIGFICALSKSLLDATYITKNEYDALINDNQQSVQTFIASLQSILTKEQYDLVIEYIYQLASNPYNGTLISGPSNPRGCAKVIYKPNNPQFAKQGGVSSSTRILKLNVDTISKSAYRNKKTNNDFMFKNKAPTCQAQTYTGNPFFFQGLHQNKTICVAKNV